MYTVYVFLISGQNIIQFEAKIINVCTCFQTNVAESLPAFILV